MAAGQGFVAVVGARVLPETVGPQVAEVVRFFLSRGWGIGSGGARGADDYALTAVLAAGPPACSRSVVFLPGAVPRGLQSLHAFVARGGRVVLGTGAGRFALLARSRRLARESAGVVAFLWGASRGSGFTVREAVRAGKPVAVVLAGGGAVLPALDGAARGA
jgi:predicted Rossmann fold nucleotide-binding protein DprA/Smf involved in DNA uptake